MLLAHTIYARNRATLHDRHSVYRHRLPPGVYTFTLFRKKETGLGRHRTCISYTYLPHCATTVCRYAHETCTRARATSVTARGAERFRARLVPSRGFLIQPVQKVLSRMQRRARKKRRLQGSSNAARPPCSLQLFLSLSFSFSVSL